VSRASGSVLPSVLSVVIRSPNGGSVKAHQSKRARAVPGDADRLVILAAAALRERTCGASVLALTPAAASASISAA
jgi:hypothetical protein